MEGGMIAFLPEEPVKFPSAGSAPLITPLFSVGDFGIPVAWKAIGLARSHDMQKPVATIENWAVVQSIFCQGFEQLSPGNRLTGHVLGHANLPSTTRIYTSPIVSVDFRQRIVETRNTIYRLGEASDEYKSWRHKREVAAAA